MRNVAWLSALLSTAWLVGCESTPSGVLEPDVERRTVELTVAPSSASIDGGSFLRLTAKLHGGAGAASVAEVLWSSSDEAVATVQPGGVVRGRGAGQATILATWFGAAGTALITVTGPVSKKPAPPVACTQLLASGGGIPKGAGCP